LVIALLLLIGGMGCARNLIEIDIPCECEEGKRNVTELKDQTLYVQYNNFLKMYVLVFKNEKESQENSQIPIVPCGYDISGKYKKEGLPVIVSGEMFDCNEYYKPNIRYYHCLYIQLSTIKKK